jgi:hypothetical protein
MTTFDEKLTAHVMEARTELGIRRAADAIGANAHALVDSRIVQSAVGAIDLQGVQDLDAAIADANQPVIEGDPKHFGVAPPAPPVAEGPRQWTRDDVRSASPAETVAAMRRDCSAISAAPHAASAASSDGDRQAPLSPRSRTSPSPSAARRQHVRRSPRP